VAGGIPIIKALREGLTANRIEWIAGIINGTSNFILSQMRATGASFESVLEQAQALGYAEADPRFDIDGVDAAHKLTILCSIAFGVPIRFRGRVHGRHRQAGGRRHSVCRAARIPDQAARNHENGRAMESSSGCTRRWCRCSGCSPAWKAR